MVTFFRKMNTLFLQFLIEKNMRNDTNLLFSKEYLY